MFVFYVLSTLILAGLFILSLLMALYVVLKTTV